VAQVFGTHSQLRSRNVGQNLIYGPAEQAAGSVIVRNMATGDQDTVPSAELADRLSGLLSG
jgi:histidyl-tRNA synthetase